MIEVAEAPFVPATAGASAAAATVLSRSAFAQTQGFAIGPEPSRYPSGVWKVLDERFRKYMIGNTPLVREWTGGMWAEGPAWNGVGRYVVFSDIPNNVQMRWDEATGKVTQLRAPSIPGNPQGRLREVCRSAASSPAGR